MLVGIIAASNIRFSPYIFFYTSILDDLNINYELIYPDRARVVDDFKKKAYKVEWKRDINPALAYMFFASKVKSIAKNERYDFLIVLTGNNVAFLSLWLINRYDKKYITDIRDYTHENIKPYYWLERIAIKHSRLNVISSKKFQSFLPEDNYLVCHNISTAAINRTGEFTKTNGPIVIGYIGKGGYIQECKKLCSLVRDDERFEMRIYGMKEVPEELKEFYGCPNISLNGQFLPAQKANIIESIDILFNVYGSGIPLLDCALSNKLYDSFVFVKPILTSPGTYMSEMAGPLSFEVDFSKSEILERLYCWYMNIDKADIESYAQRKLQEVVRENELTREKIKEALLSEM